MAKPLKFVEKGPEAGETAAEAGKPEWLERGWRLLCAPNATFSTSIRRYVNARTDDGSFFKRPFDIPIRLTSHVFGPETLSKEGGTTVARKLVGVYTDERQETHQLLGCALVLNHEFCDALQPLEIALHELVVLIEKKAIYGEKIAFADDDRAMKKLVPKFLRYESWRKMDAEDNDEALVVGTGKVGPHLSLFEPETGPYPEFNKKGLVLPPREAFKK